MSFPGGIGQGLNPVGLLGRILARASNASFGDEFPPLGEEAFPDWNEPRLRDAAKGGDGLVPILPILEKHWDKAIAAIRRRIPSIGRRGVPGLERTSAAGGGERRR